MKRYIEGEERTQVTLLPECLDDCIGEDNPVRVVDVFVEELNLGELGFDGVVPAITGRPSYHPSVLLKLYIDGYLNRIQSSRRLERECQRNVELMWLRSPMLVMIALHCLLWPSKREMPPASKTSRNSKAERRFGKQDFVHVPEKNEYRCPAGQSLIYRYTNLEAGLTTHAYWSSNCRPCSIKAQCTNISFRRIRRWEHEAVIDAMQQRMDRKPEMTSVRRQTVEHPFGTLKRWMR